MTGRAECLQRPDALCPERPRRPGPCPHPAVRSSLAASSSSAGAAQQRQQQQQQQRGRRQVSVSARAKDPDALDAGDDQAANQGVPSMFWRVFAALCYLVPWIDSISLGRQIYSRFRTLILLYFVPGGFLFLVRGGAG